MSKKTWSFHHISHLSTTEYHQGSFVKASVLFKVLDKARWCWSQLVPEMFVLNGYFCYCYPEENIPYMPVMEVKMIFRKGEGQGGGLLSQQHERREELLKLTCDW